MSSGVADTLRGIARQHAAVPEAGAPRQAAALDYATALDLDAGVELAAERDADAELVAAVFARQITT